MTLVLRGENLNSSAAWGIVSKPTNAHGATATTAKIPARGAHIRREKRLDAPGVLRFCGACCSGHDEHADDQREHENRLEYTGEFHAAQAQHGEDDERDDGQEQFAQVHVVAGDGVVESELEHAAEDVAAYERQGGRVEGHDGEIRQAQKPGAYKAMRAPEGLLRVDEAAACDGKTLDHEIVVEGDDDHDERRCGHGDERAKRACLHQKRLAGHDERAPADDAPQGKRPHVERGELFLQMRVGGGTVLHGKPQSLLSHNCDYQRSIVAECRKWCTRDVLRGSFIQVLLMPIVICEVCLPSGRR